MAYDKQKIFEQAKGVIVKHNLFFIEDIVAYLPISKPTFYDYFKVDSNEFNELRELLEINTTSVKVSLRKKWQDSDNATLQMGLMKLVSTDLERKKLTQSFTETESNVKIEDRSSSILKRIKLPSDLSDEEE